MSELTALLLGVLWFIPGVLAYGFEFATASAEFPWYPENRSASAILIALGPLALSGVLIMNRTRYGLKF